MMMSRVPMSTGGGRFMEQDGLVPTTVSEHTAEYDDVGYHSDDKGFYQQLNKSGRTSRNPSGTSTPSEYSDDTMDLFANFAESWANELMPTMSPSQLQLQPTNQPQAQQQYNIVVVNPQIAVTETGNEEASNEESSEESSDEEQEVDATIPDILSRSVKGMTVEEKKLRRRELNRLAAQRSRQKKKTCAVTSEQDVTRLTKRNAELKVELSMLEAAKTELYGLIKNHFKQCLPNNNNNMNNPNKNNNHNSVANVHAVQAKLEVPAVQAKLETPATACRGPDPTASYAAISDIYQSYAGSSGLSQEFSAAYD